jgi:undecaprenyl-diphosphatase
VYLLAKVVKGIVVRGRPDGLLADVVIRGTAAQGRGFVSGHAAVVTTLLVVAWPWLGRRTRLVVVVLAVAVCLARVHVGAHLPLDVLGGAALGLAVGGVVRLVLGHPR